MSGLYVFILKGCEQVMPFLSTGFRSESFCYAYNTLLVNLLIYEQPQALQDTIPVLIVDMLFFGL